VDINGLVEDKIFLQKRRTSSMSSEISFSDISVTVNAFGVGLFLNGMYLKFSLKCFPSFGWLTDKLIFNNFQ